MVFTKEWYLTNPHPRPMLGKKLSEETRKKISIGNTGKKLSEESKKKISQSRIGEKHPLWKGDNVSIGQLHQWVRRHKPKLGYCERCKLTPKPRRDGKICLDLSNNSYKYLRDINDYEWLCKKCHMEKDGVIDKLKPTMFKKGRTYKMSKETKIKIKLANSGDKSYLWKGGLPKCKDCGKQLSGYGRIRCRKCFYKSFL